MENMLAWTLMWTANLFSCSHTPMEYGNMKIDSPLTPHKMKRLVCKAKYVPHSIHHAMYITYIKIIYMYAYIYTQITWVSSIIWPCNYPSAASTLTQFLSSNSFWKLTLFHSSQATLFESSRRDVTITET